MFDTFLSRQRQRQLLLASFDVACWVLGAAVFALMRFADAVVVPWRSVLLAGLAFAVVYGLAARAMAAVRGRARVASLDEMVLLASATAITAVVTSLANVALLEVPRSMPIGTAAFFLILATAGRAQWRMAKERGPQQREQSKRVLLVGAGDAAHDLIQSMMRDPQRSWWPIGMLDDDPAKRWLRIRQVPVLGTVDDLLAVVAERDIEVVVVAIPSASTELIQQVSRRCGAAEVEVKVLPSTSQIFTNHVGIRDIRDINLTDVLGRNQLDTDVGAIADYLTGKRVLVTGAGGSIGSELCRQIHRYAPAELMMLDRDESALHSVELSITGRGLLDSDQVILCDIRDQRAVRAIFDDRRPEVVFHAAALKHLPMLEQYPAEAIKTNVWGTHHVLEAARAVGVEYFVNISTDKAANPTSVLGYSKRVAERLTADHARRADRGVYLSVRFGNVLGSRGSVLTAFAKQIADGGPVTVTSPDVTRFFMTIEEACQLVVQAAAIGDAGEALVLDMGEPVRILDVAHLLIGQSGQRVGIEFTGLRAGEKVHEELFADDEPQDVRPRHQLVSHVPVPPLSDDDLEDLPLIGSRPQVRQALAEACDIDGARVPVQSGSRR